MTGPQESQPRPEINGETYRSDEPHERQVEEEPSVENEPESILNKRLDGSGLEPNKEESLDGTQTNGQVGGDGAPSVEIAEQLVADESILDYEMQEYPRAALENYIKNTKEVWIQIPKKKQQKIKTKLQEQINLKGVSLQNHETIFDAWYQKQQNLYEHKNDAIYQKIYEDFLRIQKIFRLLKDNPSAPPNKIDDVFVEKQSVEVNSGSMSTKAGELSNNPSQDQDATMNTETDNPYKDMPPTENSSESPADSRPDASSNPEQENIHGKEESATSEVELEADYPEGPASLTGLDEVFDIREFTDITASNSLSELVKLWENRDDRKEESDDEYYKWRNALEFKLEKVARNNITELEVNKGTLNAIRKKLPHFFAATEDAMKVLAALNEKETSRKKVKNQREELIQEYEDINQALRQAQNWKKSGKTLYETGGGESSQNLLKRLFHIRGVDVPSREVEIMSPLPDSGSKKIDVTEFVDQYKPLSEQPFSQFDLREVIEEGGDSATVKERVSKKGMYLSANNDCFVETDGSWNKFKSYKQYGDFLKNEAEPAKTNLSWENVSKIVEEDFNEEGRYQETVSQAVQEVKEMQMIAKQKMVKGEEGKIWRIGWVDEEGAPEVGLYDAQTDQKTTVPLIGQNGRTFRQRFTAITEDQEAVDSNQPERAGEGQELTKGPISSAEIQSLIENKLPENPSEEEREAVYKEIWQKAKERGEIETLDGGSYRREQETLGGVTKPKWFRINPSGSRQQYGVAETRASLVEEGEAEMAYSKFFKDVMEEYRKHIRRQKQEKARANLSTDTVESVPQSVKEEAKQEDAEKNMLFAEGGPHRANAYYRRLDEKNKDRLESMKAKLQEDQESDGQGKIRSKLLDTFRDNPKRLLGAILEENGFDDPPKGAAKVFSQLKDSIGKSQLRKTLWALNSAEGQPPQALDRHIEHVKTTLKEGEDYIGSQKIDSIVKNSESLDDAINTIFANAAFKLKDGVTAMKQHDDVWITLKNENEEPIKSFDPDEMREELKKQLAESKSHEQTEEIEEGSLVMLVDDAGTDRWSGPKEVRGVLKDEKLGSEPHIQVASDNAWRPISDFELREDPQSHDEGVDDTVDTMPNTPENIDDYLTQERVRDIISRRDSAAAAADEILSHEGIFWDEKRYVSKTDDGLWKMHRRDGTTDAKAFFETEMISRVLRAISDHEAFTSSADEPPEGATEQISAFADGVIDIFDAFIDALPEDEGSADEVELKTSYRKLSDFVVEGKHAVAPGLLQKYRDRFVQVINHYRKHKSAVFERSGVTLNRVRGVLQQVDTALENLE